MLLWEENGVKWSWSQLSFSSSTPTKVMVSKLWRHFTMTELKMINSSFKYYFAVVLNPVCQEPPDSTFSHNSLLLIVNMFTLDQECVTSKYRIAWGEGGAGTDGQYRWNCGIWTFVRVNALFSDFGAISYTLGFGTSPLQFSQCLINSHFVLWFSY